MADFSPFEVTVPVCRAALGIDPESKEVLWHKEAKPAALAKDIVQAVQELKGQSQQRDSLFKKSLEAEKTKGDLLKKKFDEALKKAKENPQEPPPLRDLDLD